MPVAGNSWVNTLSGKSTEKVTDKGWENWKDIDAVWNTYIKLATAGTFKIKVLLTVPDGESRLSFSIAKQVHAVTVSGKDTLYDLGVWNITQPGYIKIETRGLKKDGDVFADVKELQIEGTAVDSNTIFVKNNEGNFFYWGRRGPSVHINYNLPEAENNIEWFYNEITVPVGSDPIGSYFMADGFGEGYFGMQVNSPTERRVIFSVWSPFNTDNPKEIPADKRIVLIKAGKDVEAQEFGNEGSGGHSHLVYNWKAGQTYKFLLRGKPVENNHTNYTAWFYDNNEQKWLLIASFSRPATNTYLKRLHSFLENFEPEQGDITRKAFYHNQWIKPANGNWIALNKMQVTTDNTGRKKYRMDYGGGIENGSFYLKNGGFFNNPAELKKTFETKMPKAKPKINLEELPN